LTVFIPILLQFCTRSGKGWTCG